MSPIPRPQPDEYKAYYGRYIDQVRGDDALAALRDQIAHTGRLLDSVDESRSAHRYAPDKWSIKQTVGHLTDSERVFTYRALRCAREDATPLPGYDENVYAETGRFDTRAFRDLVDEYRAIRVATIALFAPLSGDELGFRGTANDSPITARALAWIVAGHELHHLAILRERYGVQG